MLLLLHPSHAFLYHVADYFELAPLHCLVGLLIELLDSLNVLHWLRFAGRVHLSVFNLGEVDPIKPAVLLDFGGVGTALIYVRVAKF